MPDETYRFMIPGPAAPAGEAFTVKSEMFQNINVGPGAISDGCVFWVPNKKPDESEADWLRRCGVIRNVGEPKRD
jgi:hypothetical protein